MFGQMISKLAQARKKMPMQASQPSGFSKMAQGMLRRSTPAAGRRGTAMGVGTMKRAASPLAGGIAGGTKVGKTSNFGQMISALAKRKKAMRNPSNNSGGSLDNTQEY